MCRVKYKVIVDGRGCIVETGCIEFSPDSTWPYLGTREATRLLRNLREACANQTTEKHVDRLPKAVGAQIASTSTKKKLIGLGTRTIELAPRRLDFNNPSNI